MFLLLAANLRVFRIWSEVFGEQPVQLFILPYSVVDKRIFGEVNCGNQDTIVALVSRCSDHHRLKAKETEFDVKATRGLGFAFNLTVTFLSQHWRMVSTLN